MPSASSTPSSTQPSVMRRNTPCKWWARGYCRRGDQCWFDHSGTPSLQQPTSRTEASASTSTAASTTAASASATTTARAAGSSAVPITRPPTSPARAGGDAQPIPEQPECAICLDKPTAAYGLLEKCSHAFCLDCIRSWRNPEAAAAAQFQSQGQPSGTAGSSSTSSDRNPEGSSTAANRPVDPTFSRDQLRDALAAMDAGDFGPLSQMQARLGAGSSVNELHESGATKTCPLCRVRSNFIIPSSIFYPEGAQKIIILQNYRATLRNRPCRYFERNLERNGRTFCPFGDDCHFRHELYPGAGQFSFGSGFEQMRNQGSSRRGGGGGRAAPWETLELFPSLGGLHLPLDDDGYDGFGDDYDDDDDDDDDYGDYGDDGDDYDDDDEYGASVFHWRSDNRDFDVGLAVAAAAALDSAASVGASGQQAPASGRRTSSSQANTHTSTRGTATASATTRNSRSNSTNGRTGTETGAQSSSNSRTGTGAGNGTGAQSTSNSRNGTGTAAGTRTGTSAQASTGAGTRPRAGPPPPPSPPQPPVRLTPDDDAFWDSDNDGHIFFEDIGLFDHQITPEVLASMGLGREGGGGGTGGGAGAGRTAGTRSTRGTATSTSTSTSTGSGTRSWMELDPGDYVEDEAVFQAILAEMQGIMGLGGSQHHHHHQPRQPRQRQEQEQEAASSRQAPAPSHDFISSVRVFRERSTAPLASTSTSTSNSSAADAPRVGQAPGQGQWQGQASGRLNGRARRGRRRGGGGGGGD